MDQESLSPAGSPAREGSSTPQATGKQVKQQNSTSKTASNYEVEDEPQDPQSPLLPLDWDDLDLRFQQMVQTQDGKEEKLWNEFHDLIEVRRCERCHNNR
jgi:hypothetical protein